MRIKGQWLLPLLLCGLLPATELKTPLRMEEGTLLFSDGSEVSLWGVNFQANMSWEYRTRMQRSGLMTPFDAEAYRRMIDEALDELKWLAVECLRINIVPADISDMDGNLLENEWLDATDYVMAQAAGRGLYVQLTLMKDLEGDRRSPSFATRFPKEKWMVHPEAVAASERFIRALLNRANPHDNGRLYKHNPAIAVVQTINEPKYMNREQLREAPDCEAVYLAWLGDRADNAEAFAEWRYEVTRDYIYRSRGWIRDEGLAAPVVWSLNWPKAIRWTGEDVFRAAADSAAEEISVCLYPGQDRLKAPFWKYPEDLSGENFFPYLQQTYDERDYHGWMLEERFRGKARIVYEFETMANQRSHLYPAMAKLFRSLGIQMATMWTYVLPVYAETYGGTHMLNLQTTPNKAASFLAAGRVFDRLPRYQPYSTSGPDHDEFEGVWLSFEPDIAVYTDEHMLIHSADVPSDGEDFPEDPRYVVGVGNSPFLDVEGGGIHFLRRQGATWNLRLFPRAEFVREHWIGRRDGRPVVTLHADRDIQVRLPVPPGRRVRSVLLNGNPLRFQQEGQGIAFTSRTGDVQILFQ